jgi:chromosome partitioning protein
MTAKVIAMLNPKGGVGKTTLSIHLADALSRMGHNVLLVDSDPQGSARDWQNANEDGSSSFTVIGADQPKTLERAIANMRPNYDWIVIDGAAKLENMVVVGIVCADLVVVPVQPSGLDVWACQPMIETIKNRQMITGGTPAAFFLASRVKTGTVAGRKIKSISDELGVDFLPGAIHDRTGETGYAAATTLGKTVFDLDPSGAGAHEVKVLTKRIVELLK